MAAAADRVGDVVKLITDIAAAPTCWLSTRRSRRRAPARRQGLRGGRRRGEGAGDPDREGDRRDRRADRPRSAPRRARPWRRYATSPGDRRGERGRDGDRRRGRRAVSVNARNRRQRADGDRRRRRTPRERCRRCRQSPNDDASSAKVLSGAADVGRDAETMRGEVMEFLAGDGEDRRRGSSALRVCRCYVGPNRPCRRIQVGGLNVPGTYLCMSLVDRTLGALFCGG